MSNADQQRPEQSDLFRRLVHLLTHLLLSALFGLRALHHIGRQVGYALLRRLRATHALSLP